MKRFLCLFASFLLFGLKASAQTEIPDTYGIPAEILYLLPDFEYGVVHFQDQSRAEGEVNIYALDHTVHFIDDDGIEKIVTPQKEITWVQIDSVLFLRHGKEFYRMYHYSDELSIAVKREVKFRKSDPAANFNETGSVKELKGSKVVNRQGVLIHLEGNYEVSEKIFVVKGKSFYPLSRKTLRKLFPFLKAEINAWFNLGNKLPKTVEETKALLSIWGYEPS